MFYFGMKLYAEAFFDRVGNVALHLHDLIGSRAAGEINDNKRLT